MENPPSFDDARCIEWALSQPDLTTQQAGLVSVVTGAMTGAFAIWLGKETHNEPR